MNTYTTLGEGKNTAVLFDTGDGSHRKVTSTGHDTARALTRSLERVYTCVANALWDVAVAYDGQPVEARRRLLGVFDQAITAGTTAPAGSDPACWELADALVRRVADDLAGQPTAVVTAVRRELADVCLVDLDGVLVGGVLWAECYRPGYLRLVLNQFLGDWTSVAADGTTRTYSPFFDGLDVGALSLDETTTEAAIGIPTATLHADDSFSIIDSMRDLSSCHDRVYGEESARTLFSDSGEETPALEVVPTHLRAWMGTHRPDLLEAHPWVGA